MRQVVVKLKTNIPGHDWMLDFLKRHPALTARFASNIKRSRAAITSESLREYISFLAKELEDVNPANIWNFDKTNLSDDPGKKKVLVRCGVNQKMKTPWLWSASEIYRPSDRRLLAKLVPTFADRVCHVVSAMDSHCR
jgi:hypothetical protein